MDAKNVHSNWTKEAGAKKAAERGERRKRNGGAAKRDAAVVVVVVGVLVDAEGVRGKPGKTQITISEGVRQKRGRKSTCVGKNVATSNSGRPMRAESAELSDNPALGQSLKP